MKKYLKLPASIGDIALLGSISKLHSILGKHSPSIDRIILDWQRTKTILPAGYAILATIADLYVKSKVLIENVNLSKHLLKINPIKKFINSSKSPEFPKPDLYNFFSKNMLLKVKDSSIDAMLKEDFEQCFMNIDEDLFYDTMLILNELMQNSIDHSSSERYYYYIGKAGNELHFGLLDNGISIPGRLQNDYDADKDIDFLLMSLKPDIGTRTIRRGGLVLDILKNVVKNNKGRIVLLSRRAQYRKYFSTRRSQKNTVNDPIKGTWWMLRFPWRAK